MKSSNETATQAVKRFVENHIKDVQNVVIIFENKDGGVTLTHNGVTWRELIYMLKVADDTVMNTHREET